MKKYFYVAVAAVLTALSASTFTSCKDSDDVTNLSLTHNKDFQDLKGQIQALKDQIATLQAQIQAIKQCDCDKNKVAALEKKVAELESALADLATKSDLDAYVTKAALEKAIADLKQEILDTLDGKLDVLQKNLEGQIEDIKKMIEGIGSCNCNLTPLQEKLAELEAALAECAKKSEVDALKSDVDALKSELLELTGKFNSFVIEITNTLDEKIQALQAEIARLDGVDAATKAKLEELAAELANKASQAELNAVKADLAAVKVDLVELTQKFIAFKSEVKSTLKNLVTGISVNEVKNNAFGSYNGLFSSIQSTILVGYYGINAEVDEIPATVKLGQINFSVNPAEIEGVEAQQFSLINSLGVEKVKITDVKKATEALHSGVTRGEAVYSYTGEVTVPLAQAKQNFNIDLNKAELKDQIKTMMDSKEFRPTVKSLATIIYDVVKSMSVERLAMKSNFAYTIDGETINNTQVTGFDMTAVAVKPLGFNAYEFKGVPGYGFVRNAAKKVMDKVMERVQTTIYDKLTGSELIEKMNEFQANLKEIKVIPDPERGDADYVLEVRNARGVLLGYVNVKDIIMDIFNDINAGIGDANKVFKSASEMVDAINKLINSIKDPVSASFTDPLFTKLDKYNEKIGAKLNHLFEPVMLIQTEKGLSRAGFAGVPSVVSGKVTLIPTTYSAEILTPIFSKKITVNGSEVLNVTQDPGATYTISEPGEYTIVYGGTDYSGNSIDADTHTYKIIVK